MYKHTYSPSFRYEKVCAYVHICIYIYICMYVCIYINTHIAQAAITKSYMRMCMYIYTYIHIYAYTIERKWKRQGECVYVLHARYVYVRTENTFFRV